MAIETGRKMLVRNAMYPRGSLAFHIYGAACKSITVVLPESNTLVDLTQFAPIDVLLGNADIKGLIDRGHLVLVNAEDFSAEDWGDPGKVEPTPPAPEPEEQIDIVLTSALYEDVTTITGTAETNAIIRYQDLVAMTGNSGQFTISGVDLTGISQISLLSTKEGFVDKSVVFDVLPLRTDLELNVADFSVFGTAHVTGTPGLLLTVNGVSMGLLGEAGADISTGSFYTNENNNDLIFVATLPNYVPVTVSKKGDPIPVPMGPYNIVLDAAPFVINTAKWAFVKIGTDTEVADEQGRAIFNQPITALPASVTLGAEGSLYIPVDVTLEDIPMRKSSMEIAPLYIDDTQIAGKITGDFNPNIPPLIVASGGGVTGQATIDLDTGGFTLESAGVTGPVTLTLVGPNYEETTLTFAAGTRA